MLKSRPESATPDMNKYAWEMIVFWTQGAPSTHVYYSFDTAHKDATNFSKWSNIKSISLKPILRKDY